MHTYDFAHVQRGNAKAARNEINQFALDLTTPALHYRMDYTNVDFKLSLPESWHSQLRKHFFSLIQFQLFLIKRLSRSNLTRQSKCECIWFVCSKNVLLIVNLLNRNFFYTHLLDSKVMLCLYNILIRCVPIVSFFALNYLANNDRPRKNSFSPFSFCV